MLTLKDIEQAHERIKPHLHRTPIVSSALLNQYLGHNIYFKAECLQKTGAFKARGALNTLLWLQQQKQKIKRVVASSSGNHAQALAWSAAKLNIPVTIFMPNNVSKIKAQATQAYGAELVVCETRQQADAMAKQAGEQDNVFYIPPFNHQQVICGQGTAVYEALIDLKSQGVEKVDAVFAPCGGGGMLSGAYISAKGFNENIKVFGVEPLVGNDAAQSVRAGEIVTLEKQPSTLADGAMTLAVGDISFDYLKQLDGIFEVDESQIAYWTQWLNHLLKLTIEATCCMSMEGVRQYLQTCSEKQIVLVILTGGNIDNNSRKAIWQDDHLTLLPSL